MSPVLQSIGKLAVRPIASLLITLVVCGFLVERPARAQGSGRVEIDFVEQGSDEPLSARVQILDAKGKPLKARGALFENGWNCVESPLTFRGRTGDYRYRVSAGPQFAMGGGVFTLDRGSEGYDIVRLPRHANLEEEGWFAGDLSTKLPAAQVLPWLAAEGLHMATVIGQQVRGEQDADSQLRSQGKRWVEDTSYWDDREGSGLVLHHWRPPATVPSAVPSSRLIVMAKSDTTSEPTVHVEIARPWARDLPIWLASGRIDSFRVLGSHLTPTGKGGESVAPLIDPAPGKFRGDRAAGRIVESLYWKVLEAGLRIPPSAGSDFGRRNTFLGYNRLYVAVDELAPESWWAEARKGRSFVTSGPLLRVKINDVLPGAVFRSDDMIELDISLTLTTADPVAYLDVIYNGDKLYEARLDEVAKQGGKIPLLKVSESGWLVVRVVTERDFTYRIAMTAPYYCEIGGQRRVSREAVEFFRRWLKKSEDQLNQSPQADSASPYLRAADKFWQTQLENANTP